MKKIFNIKKIALVALGAAAITSCTSDWLDVNTTPNDPLAANVSPDFILAGAQSRAQGVQSVTMNRLGNVYMYNWGANVNAFTGGLSQEFSLTLTTSFYSGIWDGLFNRIGNFQEIINSDYENYENHKAIAKIMKVYYYQYLVDIYGDVPYTEAFQRTDNLTPVYDNQKDVYFNLIGELDEALELINGITAETFNVGAEDVIYNGIMTKWVTFANTVKLKMLVRMSSQAQNNSELQTFVDAQFQTLQGVDFVTSDVTINPGYTQDAGKQNPFYGDFYLVNGDAGVSFRFYRAADYAVRYMNGTITGVTDPRITEIYAPLGGGVVGVLQGADDNTAPEAISTIGPGLLRGDDQDGIVMLASTSYFLQAEAVFRNYMPGNAESLFNAGVESSFAFYGVDPSTYQTISQGIDEISWGGSANKIEAIMTQKWIATNGINAIESWIDYTRTGFPELPLPLTAQNSSRPNKLLYPTSELVANAANVPSQTQQSAFTEFIFWDPQN